MDPTKLTVSQLKSELKRTWQRYSAIKEKMAPLLYELRKKLRAPGNRKGEGWAAWIEAGHIGICVRTANRWADEYAGKKPTSGQKSRGFKIARGQPLPDGVVRIDFVLNTEEQRSFEEAKRILKERGEKIGRVIYEAVLAAANQKSKAARAGA